MPSSSTSVAARRPVGLERLRLAARAVQREHQLAAQPLAQRVLGDERLELADELGVPPQREVGVDPGLQRGEAQLVQPRDRRPRANGSSARSASGGPRHSASASRRARRRARPAASAARPRDELLEAVEVELARLDAQQVARAARVTSRPSARARLRSRDT